MNPGKGGEYQVAQRLPEVLRLPAICRRCGNEGPDLRRLYEETGSGIGTEGPKNAGRLQRAGGEPVEGDPVSLLVRR